MVFESEEPPIRILLVDDHPIVRFGLKARLSLEPDFEVVGETSDGLMALDLASKLHPDVVLLDLSLESMGGLSVLQAMHTTSERVKVIVLTASEDRNQFVQALKLGCSGIVLKKTSSDLIVRSIRKVNSGEMWLDSGTTSTIAARLDSKTAELSRRECEIAQLVAHGLKNKQMAEKMFISEQTVKNHLHSIYQKLGVSDRVELAIYSLHRYASANAAG